MTAPSQARLKTACEAVSQTDAGLARAYDEHGLPTWRSAPAAYETIARTVAFQMISLSAAGAIWGRVCGDLGEITPRAILDCDEDVLRGHGMSRPKVRHLRSIAEAVESGALDLKRVCAADLDDARAELLAVSGIGPWTADIFLLYAVGAMDAFPTADVGLMESYRLLSGVEERLDAKAFTAAAEAWRPHRGVAAHLLWGWLHDYRDRANKASPRA